MINFIGTWPAYIAHPVLLDFIEKYTNNFWANIGFALGILSSYVISFFILKIINKMTKDMNKYAKYTIITLSAIVLFTGPVFCTLFTLIFTFAK